VATASDVAGGGGVGGGAAPRVSRASASEIDTFTLYALLRLRSEAFHVEQQCAYLDLDGRDLEDGAVHMWIEDVGRPVCVLRLLVEGEGSLIGRVVTDPAHRGRGLAEQLMRAALHDARRPVVINAQARLRDWYVRLGFRPIGDEYLHDGIPHVEMRID
jgi:ElaA protein